MFKQDLKHKFTVFLSPLDLLKSKEQGIIKRLKSSDENLLEQIVKLGIVPRIPITLEQRFPSSTVAIGENQIEFNREIARSIYVRVVK
ncbi:MAG: ferrous iron transport protein A [Cyanobacteria bacterium SBLK]|nr:ferrous iron transport protein A [Cyanobacteria bacterium SBLK]